MIQNIYIQYNEFRAHCFSGQATSCSKVLKDKKCFNTVKNFMTTLFYRPRKLFKNLNDEKSVMGRQGREGRKFLP